jgi:hypothetical protein
MELVKEISALDSDDSEHKEISKIKTETKKSTSKMSENALKKKAKNDLSKYLPLGVLFLSRLEMFIIIYKYHCPLNLIHLFWILLTFLLSDDNVFLVSMYSMIPLLFWEFLFIYAIRIPIVKDTVFM